MSKRKMKDGCVGYAVKLSIAFENKDMVQTLYDGLEALYNGLQDLTGHAAFGFVVGAGFETEEQFESYKRDETMWLASAHMESAESEIEGTMRSIDALKKVMKKWQGEDSASS